MNANSIATTHNWLLGAKETLRNAGIATAELDALVLLEDCLQVPRANLLAHPETMLTKVQLSTLNAQIKRRAAHEPLAYIRRKTEFYGREFIVNQYTLEPRPETEMMIELLKKQTPENSVVIADIGTGSGALGITAQLELPSTTVLACDISQECLEVARKNDHAHDTKITFYRGDLLDAFEEQQIDVLLCNLPYVPDDFKVNKAASHEPKIALFGGQDGLDYYRTLFLQIDSQKHKPALVFTESLPSQHKDLVALAKNSGYTLKAGEDFIQVFERKN